MGLKLSLVIVGVGGGFTTMLNDMGLKLKLQSCTIPRGFTTMLNDMGLKPRDSRFL